MVPSIRASWELVGDQLKGQRAIVGYQREELAIPEIGEVYKLNTPDGQTSQFVRVTSVDHSVVTFTYNNGSEYVDFERRKIEMQISAPLIETFPGEHPVPGMPVMKLWLIPIYLPIGFRIVSGTQYKNHYKNQGQFFHYEQQNEIVVIRFEQRAKKRLPLWHLPASRLRSSLYFPDPDLV